jgi:hypothetical protein
MFVAHYCNRSRASLGISAGLVAAQVKFAQNFKYVSLGREFQDAEPDMQKACLKADVILIADSPDASALEVIDKHNLWHKTVHYDYRDTTKVENTVSKVARYFKRSLVTSDRQLAVNLNLVEPLHHCTLDEYYVADVPKDKDIGCFFSRTNLDGRRLNLLDTLDGLGLNNSLIGYSTGEKQPARMAVFENKENNMFYDFLLAQKRCKVVFTAQPTHCEGDNRTWEAMASKALVFLDKTYQPMHNPLVDGVHCCKYDASDRSSILAAVDRAKWYLDHPEELEQIALAGYEFTLRYHRPINRIRPMLSPFLV